MNGWREGRVERWTWCLFVLLGSLPFVGEAYGQAIDSLRVTEADVISIASFADAQALAAAPNGRLYVVDAGRNVVVVLDTLGGRRLTLGGIGSGPGEFDTPADVDPTNGLTLLVADAGNGRIQRFTEEGQLIEILPVGRQDASGGRRGRQPTFDVGEDGIDVRTDGRPVAVVSTSTNETLAIDASANVVRTWDAQRRPGPVIGGFGQRAGALREPVALALDRRDRLYVADRGHAAVLVYDPLGTYLGRLPLPPLPEIQALDGSRNRLWVVSPDQVHVVEVRSQHLAEVGDLDLREPVVDVALQGRTLYVLTPTRLLRRRH